MQRDPARVSKRIGMITEVDTRLRLRDNAEILRIGNMQQNNQILTVVSPEEKMLSLVGSDFDINGNVYLNHPIEASQVKVVEVAFTNLLPTANIASGSIVNWQELDGGPALTATIEPAVYTSESLGAKISEKMTAASAVYHGGGPASLVYNVSLSLYTGITQITVLSKTGVPKQIRLFNTEFITRVLGFSDILLPMNGDTLISAYTYNMAHGTPLVLTSNLVPSSSSSHGKNQESSLCVIPLMSPSFYSTLHRPVTPWISLGGTRVISSLQLNFKSADLTESYNDAIFSPSNTMHIVMIYR